MAVKGKTEFSFLQSLERIEKPRLENSLSKRKYYLIVCEGEATEPNYFEVLKNDLPKGVLEVCEFRIEGTGYNTESLVKKSLEIKNDWEQTPGRIVDKLWIVFDKDNFSAQTFNTAINTCLEQNNEENIIVEPIWSNEAFELWYLLHFIYFDTAIRRTEYKRMLQEQLTKKIGMSFKYLKNSKLMYPILKKYGSYKLAIKSARRLAKQWGGREDYANHKPATMVYKIIEELFGLEEQLKHE
jgi:hypothetical protein